MTARVGVLALQGDVREHSRVLAALGVEPVPVRRPGDLDAVQGLVLPGGESSVIDKLARAFGMREPIRAAIVKATTFFDDPKVIAEVSRGLGEAMVGINENEIALLMAERGT